MAEFHRAVALFENGSLLEAEKALASVMAKNPGPEILREALLLSARLEVQNKSPAQALDLYEKMISQTQSERARAQARWEAAKLAFELGQWERARKHAQHADRKRLPMLLRYKSELLGVRCSYALKQPEAGLKELAIMAARKEYTPFRPEISLRLAEGLEMQGQWEKAEKTYRIVPEKAPATDLASEAYFRMGEYTLQTLKDEKEAKVLFDSAAAMGTAFEFGARGAERAAALARLFELRDTPPMDSTQPRSQDFLIAELFLFNLDRADSALARLDSIVARPQSDSFHAVRAAYARAYIRDEIQGEKSLGDSLYRFVLEKFPGTEWAKQAEVNLGRPPTVVTRSDEAHRLFLEAEKLRFAGADAITEVIPAYRKVVMTYPGTADAPKAQYVVAHLFETRFAQGDSLGTPWLDSAKQAYSELRESFGGTVYSRISDEKLAAAGVVPTLKPSTTASSDSTQPFRHGKPSSDPDRGQSTPSEPVEIPDQPYREVLEGGGDDVY
jgi:tetratricopeptide (TPR) repeat protein